ncbi:MAG: hypothetical protein VW268_01710 [Rhodospirillaceae bacterium]
MAPSNEAQFDKADEILARALQEFMQAGVSQEVYGMALLEIGVLALVRLDEPDADIQDLVRDFAARARQGVPTLPAPREN